MGLVGLFVRSLRQSFWLKFLKCVYLGNHLSEIIHIWTKVTHEGWDSAHDFGLGRGQRSRSRTPLTFFMLNFAISTNAAFLHYSGELRGR